MSKIEVDAIEPQSGTTLTIGASGDTITIPSGATLTNNGTATGFGKVLQVVSTTKTDTFSTASASFVDVTGLSVSITPSSASNKILVIASITGANDGNHCYVRLMNDATAICIGDASNSNTRASGANLITNSSTEINSTTLNFLHSPATTSSTTYKIQVLTNSGTVFINKPTNTVTTSASARTPSTITVMEIAG
jgi:hypothetical protein